MLTHLSLAMPVKLDPRVVLFAVMVIVGLVLWLFGRRLTKPLCILLGTAAGALAGFVLADQLKISSSGIAIYLMCVVGAAVGVLVSWLLFRLWMALTLGILMAVLLGYGMPGVMRPWLNDGGRPPIPHEAASYDGSVGAALTQSNEEAAVIDQAVVVVRRVTEAVRNWWAYLSPRGRQLAVAAGLIGLFHGLILGIWKPLIAASLQTAFAGALLLVWADWSLVIPRLSADTLDGLRHSWVAPAAVGLITILGVIVQWTIRRRQTDK
ncbi:MAG: hypothetical protein K8S99_08665 [Planctomycetes bacterium]|nr:hypothetical protein [Planctomycetota bacterium]